MSSLTEIYEDAQRLFIEKKYSESKVAFEKLLTSNFEVARSHYFLGLIDAIAKKFAEAKKHLIACYELEPTNSNCLFFIGEIYEEEGNRDSALYYYNRSLEMNPLHKSAKSKIARLVTHAKPKEPLKKSHPPIVNQVSKVPEKAVNQREPDEIFQGDLFDQLLEANDAYSKAAVKTIRDIRVVNQKPRLTAYAGSFFIFALFIPLPLFVRQLAGSYGAYLLILLLPFISAIFITDLALSIKSFKVTIDRGLIETKSGLFTTRRNIYNIHLVRSFEVSQSFLDKLTGNGTLTFINTDERDPKKQSVKMKGIAKYDKLVDLATRLNSLHFQLRSSAVIKSGVYN
jgi:tetratricopeptide (TPR) repeat protein